MKFLLRRAESPESPNVDSFGCFFFFRFFRPERVPLGSLLEGLRLWSSSSGDDAYGDVVDEHARELDQLERSKPVKTVRDEKEVTRLKGELAAMSKRAERYRSERDGNKQALDSMEKVSAIRT